MLAKQFKEFLLYLGDLPLDKFKIVLKGVTRVQLKAIREVVRNIVKGSASVSSEVIRSLVPHKAFLREFARKGMPRCYLSKRASILLKTLRLAKDVIKEL